MALSAHIDEYLVDVVPRELLGEKVLRSCLFDDLWELLSQ